MEPPAPQTRSYRGYLTLILGILSIAMSPIMVRWTNAPGVITSFYRLLFGSLLMALPFGIQVKNKPQSVPRRGVWFGILAGFFFALDMFFWSTGIMMSGATNPTFLANTAPLWVGLGAWLIYREPQKLKFWMGLLTAVIGAALVLGQDLRFSAELGLGTFFGLISAVFYGGFQLVGQHGRRYLNTLAYFWISTTASAFFLLVIALVLQEPLWGYSIQTWLMFLIMAVLVQCIGWLLVNRTALDITEKYRSWFGGFHFVLPTLHLMAGSPEQSRPTSVLFFQSKQVLRK